MAADRRRLPLAAALAFASGCAAESRCPNAAENRLNIKRDWEKLVARDYVGQQQSWHYVTPILQKYSGLQPRATCEDWTLHFTGPSGSGKTFLAELIATAAFEPWAEEAYSIAQLGVAAGGGALGGALGMIVGPIGGGLGAGVGAYAATAAWDKALSFSPTLARTFRAPKPFPSQCGVVQHKFSRASDAAEVAQWEYSVAKQLQKDAASVIIVDDIGRLKDAGAFEHFGRLLCGVGGNAVPEFRTGPSHDADRISASQALFVLTSDLELDPADPQVSCELEAFDTMLDAVRKQSGRFWSERGLAAPDWWDNIPLVPFRELCADELQEVVQRYLARQADLATQEVEADLRRRSSWAVGAQRVLQWTGTVKFGAGSFNALNLYVQDAIAHAKLGGGGRPGGWVIQDFHKTIMKPALQRLTAAYAERGAPAEPVALVTTGDRLKETTWYNYTTLTYTSEICLDVTARDDAPGALPRVAFSIMNHGCR